MTLITRNHLDRTRSFNPTPGPPGRPTAWQQHQTSCDEALEREPLVRLGPQPDKAGPALAVDTEGTAEPATDLDSNEGRPPLLGTPAPTVTGASVHGDAFDMGATDGQSIVLNFFATWCRASRLEHPELERFAAAHRVLGDATVVSVLFADTPHAARIFLAEHGGRRPIVIDPDGRLADRFGVRQVPESYLVGPSGLVVARLVGGVRAEGLEAFLPHSRTVRFDRPRGCS